MFRLLFVLVVALTVLMLPLQCRIKSLQARLVAKAVPSTREVTSRIQCAAYCLKTKNCVSFSVDKNECVAFYQKYPVDDQEANTQAHASYYDVEDRNSVVPTQPTSISDKDPITYDYVVFKADIKTFHEANEDCAHRLNNGRLVRIHDKETQATIDQVIKEAEVEFDSFWIGLIGIAMPQADCQSDYHLQWIDGRPINTTEGYSNFNECEPRLSGEICVFLSSVYPLSDKARGKWKSASCKEKYSYICQHPKSVG